MSTALRPRAMWCIGVPTSDVACLRGCVGKECRVSMHDECAFDDESLLIREEPALIWIDASRWDVAAARASSVLPSVPRVMVCAPGGDARDLDAFISSDAEFAARSPLTQDGVFRILRRSLEQHNIYQDMCRMTREIFLSRELLTRKSDVLHFLFEADRLLTSTEAERDMLHAVGVLLRELLDVQALHAVLWDFETAEDGLDLYFEGIEPGSEAGRAWEMFLLDTASRLLPYVPPVRRTERLDAHQAHQQSAYMDGHVAKHAANSGILPPDAGHVLVLPLAVRDAAAGALVLLLPCDPCLSRDQSLALRMVMSHVASLLRLASREDAVLGQPAARLSYDDALSRMRLAQ